MNSIFRRVAHVSVGALALFSCIGASAAPGDLDTSFGVSGRTEVTFASSTSDSATSVAVLPGGKILVAGSCAIQGDYDFCLARLNSNGTLDSASGFGTGGKTTATVGNGNDFARAMAVQPDGRIVLAGECAVTGGTNFCLVRFTANGALDQSFGSSGRAIQPVQGNADSAFSIALQGDGKILVAGECVDSGTTYACLARYLSDGALDTAFGSGGKVNTNFGTGSVARLSNVKVAANNDIVVAGHFGSNRNFFARRFNSSGVAYGTAAQSIDFGSSSSDTNTALAIQADGKIVLGGVCVLSGLNRACAARLTPSSASSGFTVDATFGTNGEWLGASASPHAINAVEMQPDGRVVVGGGCLTSGFYCVARLTPGGVPDESFQSGNFSYVNMGTGISTVRAIAMDANAKIVAVGECRDDPGTYKFCAMRLEGGPTGYRNCSLDLDGDGVVRATTDALIMTRISLGMTGTAALANISFPQGSTRTNWDSIRAYLVSQCGMSLAP